MTKFRWVIGSPGQEPRIRNMLFSKSSLHDYEKLCSLDCLGVEERRDDTNYVFREFQKYIGRGPEGPYETSWIWKDKYPPLKNSKSNILGRLSSIVENLTHRDELERYNNIIRDQVKEAIVEKVDEGCEQEIAEGKKLFYLFHIDVSLENQLKQLN